MSHAARAQLCRDAERCEPVCIGVARGEGAHGRVAEMGVVVVRLQHEIDAR